MTAQQNERLQAILTSNEMKVSQLINKHFPTAYRFLITTEKLDVRHSELTKRILPKGTITTVEHNQYEKQALHQMFLCGDFNVSEEVNEITHPESFYREEN